MTAVLVGVAALLGLVAGALVNRLAGRFPWPAGARPGDLLRPGTTAVRPPVVELATALLLALTALHLGASAALPAYLLLAVTGVLLVLVDARHQLLPDRVVLPALGSGAALLAGAAALTGEWPAFGRALLGALALFAAYLVLAVVSPSGLGMGDVKLAALLGLHLGWLGWGAVLLGGVAGFVVQAVLALVLLAARRVRRDSALPFGPAMLIGAAAAIGLLTS